MFNIGHNERPEAEATKDRWKAINAKFASK
jgi:hypothetical protein